MNIYYVYAYLRKDNTPYYIGKGKENRAFDKNHSIAVPIDQSRIMFIEQNLTEQEALSLEIKLINQFGRKDLSTGILRNKTNGGEGLSGYKHTKKTKQKMSKPKSKNHVANMAIALTGRTLTAEHCANMAAVRLGKKRGPYKKKVKS